MIKRTIFLLLLCAVCALSASAQGYKSAIGLRLGYPVSASYKNFISKAGAIEVFAGFRSYPGYSWFNVAGAYELHKAIPGVDGLQWYFGGGVSAFFWNFKDNFVTDASSSSFGLLGTLGLDYKFADVPVNLSVDWMPIFFLNGYGSGFGGGYGALSARYTLN